MLFPLLINQSGQKKHTTTRFAYRKFIPASRQATKGQRRFMTKRIVDGWGKTVNILRSCDVFTSGSLGCDKARQELYEKKVGEFTFFRRQDGFYPAFYDGEVDVVAFMIGGDLNGLIKRILVL